jgi:hypothetical protein
MIRPPPNTKFLCFIRKSPVKLSLKSLVIFPIYHHKLYFSSNHSIKRTQWPTHLFRAPSSIYRNPASSSHSDLNCLSSSYVPPTATTHPCTGPATPRSPITHPQRPCPALPARHLAVLLLLGRFIPTTIGFGMTNRIGPSFYEGESSNARSFHKIPNSLNILTWILYGVYEIDSFVHIFEAVKYHTKKKKQRAFNTDLVNRHTIFFHFSNCFNPHTNLLI